MTYKTKKLVRTISRTHLWWRIRYVRSKRWWWRNQRRYGWKWRIGNFAAAVLLLISVFIPLAQQLYQSNRYQLSADAVKLVGSTNQTLTKQLTYDASKQLYQFNKDAISTSGLPPQLQKASVGTPGNKNSSTYALDVPQDFSKGVTYHDVNSSLCFSLVPQFKAMAGKQVNGRLVFPADGNMQAVYTLKGNGLKEDIVVPKASSDSMRFNYTLNLPKSLEAKVIPDSNGAIGIYSGDPSLFGNITYGSSKDQALVEKARDAADKNYLVFGLPAPVIKTADGKLPADTQAQFKLSGNQLSVVASGLKAISGAFSVDPSVVVTSSSDFQTNGNNEGNIDFSISGQITRGGLTGGSISGGWTAGNAYANASEYSTSAVYNGYIYQIAGDNRSPTSIYNTVQYATLNSDGSIGTWNTTTSLPNNNKYSQTAVYDGYLYVIGGFWNNLSTNSNLDYFTKINSDGSLNSWNAATNLPTGVNGGQAVAYNSYMYVLGGSPGAPAGCGGSSNCTNIIYEAAINADGTLGTWNTLANTFSSARALLGAAAYNGYMYIAGGSNTGYLSDVQYAQINTDGTLGTWHTTTSFATARQSPNFYFYKGYAYVIGGNSGTVQSGVQYAQVNANGTLGSWTASTALSAARTAATGGVYNGYLYVLGGYDGSADNANTQYAKIDPAGAVAASSTWGTTTAFTTTRYGNGAVAYNGFLYVLGGGNPSSTTSVYYSTISSSGTVGAWTSTNALRTGLTSAGYVAYNGYMYAIGGFAGTNTYNTVEFAAINTNGTLGTWNYTHSSTNDGATSSGLGLATARYGMATAVYNGYLYIIAGADVSGGYFNTVEYAPFNSDGTIGTFATTSSIMTARYGVRAVTYGKYIYIIGGLAPSNSTYPSDVQFVPINSDGTLGTWHYTHNSTDDGTTYVAGLTHGTQSPGMAIINGYIYVWGGHDGSTYYTDTWFAPVNSNGTVGTWTQTVNYTATGVYSMGATSYNGVLYSLGGKDSAGTYYTTTSYAAVNNGGTGSTGTWATNGTDISGAYANGWAYGNMFAANGYLYTVGGYDSANTTHAQTYSAPINADGSVGSWTAQSTMNTPRYQFGLAVANGYVYALAGENFTTALNTYEYASIGTGGTLGTWAQGSITASGSAIGARYAVDAAASGTHVYLTGGQNGGTRYSDVYGATANSNGSLTWLASPVNSFTGVRSFHKSFAYNGYLYIVGGYTGSAYYNDVQFAPVNSDGTLGSWAYTSNLMQARGIHTLAVANGYVYILGGTNSVGGLTDVEKAPIYANGALGAWERTPGSFTNARSNTAATISNGVLYMVGGYKSSGSVYYSDVQYTPLNAIARVGHYSKLLDFGTAVTLNSFTYNGIVPMNGNTTTPIMIRTAGSSLTSFGSPQQPSAIGSGTTSCSQLGVSNTRYLWVSITLDGSAAGIYTDASGTLANVTDFTVTYTPTHPAPNIRLRAGQTLQSGNLSALDTCGP